ncbi:STAS/SEC14 domain-containing protein [Crocosphaera sp. UHCC 0190]|uniref:STAS/SEC14 domain-containing protein n=1 Tax=Crocosphaera sp. UHCC 0190 TaxID=3110246 RepID=UPI002B20FC65|nr:STAS/SEC14 domain-containing protein [Crocosphaera sp. UHCC 0190]MEA5509893.1 STAS/SEC14 domain-containing protein [Crocosphaera sp. UHCC 0190]
MLNILTDLPDQVLAFSAVGNITADDYETLLIPIVKEKLKKYGKVRLLYHLGTEFNHFSMMALWDDLKFGLAHWNEWEKIAVVTDSRWLRGMIQIFRWLIPARFKLFQNKELEQARQWISK